MDQAYGQIVKHIEAQRDRPAREGSFERFRHALEALTSERPLKFNHDRTIVIAGTNGKGSTAKALQTLLSASGFRVGLFTSPHLIETTERIRIDGEPVSQSEFVRAYHEVQKWAALFSLGHFEILTLMAAEIFFAARAADRTIDWVIFEVGVGGEFDPTRLMPHATSVITPLSFDHEKILGATMTEIARAKLGIIENENLVVYAPWSAEAAAVAESTRARRGGRWVQSETFSFLVGHDSDGEPIWTAQTPWGDAPTDLVGRRGIENISLALNVYAALGLDPSKVLRSLAHVAWPGRMEAFRVPGFKNKIYLSGDHNHQGVASLVELLAHYSGHMHFIVGIADGKEAQPMLEALSRVKDSSLYLTQTSFRPRSLDHGYGRWRERAVCVDADAMSALRKAGANAQSGDRLIVTGSLYLIGDIRQQLLSIGGCPCHDRVRGSIR